MSEKAGVPEGEQDTVDAVPFYCVDCNTDVKLKTEVVEEGNGDTGISCECLFVPIIDFSEQDLPSKWSQKGDISP